MSAKIFWTIVITGGFGGALVAQAQVGSPFANKKKRQAWETPQTPPAQNPQAQTPQAQTPLPQTSQPQQRPWSAPQNLPQARHSQEIWVQDTREQESFISSSSELSYPPLPQNPSPQALSNPSPRWEQYPAQSHSQTPRQARPHNPVQTYEYKSAQPLAQTYQAPLAGENITQSTSSFYEPQSAPPPASRSPFAPTTPQTYQNLPAEYYAYEGKPQSARGYQAQAYQGQSYPSYEGQAPQNPAYQNAQYQGQYNPNQYNRPQAQAAKRSWKERLGLGNIATSLKGFLKIGGAAVRRESDGTGINEWDDGYIGDGQIRGEVSAITQGGLEYGVGGVVRGQFDEFRRGFGGLVGDCPPDVAGCASVDVNGVATPVRGHTSRFFTSGTSDAKRFEFGLEGAYGFLRSSYGDITIGRDDGAAYLFSLGAPSLVAVNASNSSVDYTGLDSVKTVNDASGFSEKITYVSPRLLGDRIGVGVQVGASYALNARACGVDFCVRDDDFDETGALAPDLDDVIEFGLSLDRTFQNGVSVEATATYARASEQSNLDAFDDLQTFGAGLELEWNDFTLGGSWLTSNNGLQDGDYDAWDVGLSWKPAQWGTSISYGHANDESINLTSDQITFGAVYDFSERFTLGTGVQYVDRSVPFVTGGIPTEQDERGIGLFVEGKVTF